MKPATHRIRDRYCALALALAVVCNPVFGSDIVVENAETEISNDMVVVNADASFDFHEDAIRALNSGIALIIDLDIKITRPRRYLWDPELIRTHRRYSIERHALSEQFILTDLVTGDRRIHSSLALAIDDLGRIRGLPLAEVSELNDEESYNFSLRLRLDIESLPAPMIPLAYISPGWRMSSGWYRWTRTR